MKEIKLLQENVCGLTTLERHINELLKGGWVLRSLHVIETEDGPLLVGVMEFDPEENTGLDVPSDGEGIPAPQTAGEAAVMLALADLMYALANQVSGTTDYPLPPDPDQGGMVRLCPGSPQYGPHEFIGDHGDHCQICGFGYK